jgi:hypothetical protein
MQDYFEQSPCLKVYHVCEASTVEVDFLPSNDTVSVNVEYTSVAGETPGVTLLKSKTLDWDNSKVEWEKTVAFDNNWPLLDLQIVKTDGLSSLSIAVNKQFPPTKREYFDKDGTKYLASEVKVTVAYGNRTEELLKYTYSGARAINGLKTLLNYQGQDTAVLKEGECELYPQITITVGLLVNSPLLSSTIFSL